MKLGAIGIDKRDSGNTTDVKVTARVEGGTIKIRRHGHR